MARTTSVSLNDHDADFIDAQVEQGSYDSPSDVVSAGLELLEQAKTKALVEALIEGEESGEPQPFDGEAFIVRMKQKYGA